MAKLQKDKTAEELFAEWKPDYPPEICEARTNEVIRRMCGLPPAFDLNTNRPIVPKEDNKPERA